MDFFLEDNGEACCFLEALQEIYDKEQPLTERLSVKLAQYDDRQNAKTVARKLRNWKQEGHFPKNREELFKICFALELTEEQANDLLGMTAESGIHFRNPREVIYAYCLRKKIDYPEASEMVVKYWGKELPAGGREYREYFRSQGCKESAEHFTDTFRKEFQNVQTEKELEEFLQEREKTFGMMHNTAYRKFLKMLECLRNPRIENAVYPKEQTYSIRKIVNDYIRMEIPYKRKTDQYTRVQREIRKHWPSERSIYEMYNRKLDVDRKTLLLLYLATEGEGMQETEEDSIQEHQRKIDVMLTECGMPVLSPKNPFDCLVMQVCRGASEEDYIGMRMENAIQSIFTEEEGGEQER